MCAIFDTIFDNNPKKARKAFFQYTGFIRFIIFIKIGTILASVYIIIDSQKNGTTYIREKGVIVMGRMRENPRYNVISMRVSDEERDHLDTLMKTTHKSISDIMREAMEYFSAHYEQEGLNRKAA